MLNIEETIEFLKELQEEINSQTTDGQADPRFWAIGDYEEIATGEDYCDWQEVYMPQSAESYKVDDDLKSLLLEDAEEDAEQKIEELFTPSYFDSIDIDDLLEYIKENVDEDAYMVFVSNLHKVKENTMFLTKKEATAHLENNHYHYTKEAHTYAMTAWRSPQVEKLYDAIKNTDWSKLKEEPCE